MITYLLLETIAFIIIIATTFYILPNTSTRIIKDMLQACMKDSTFPFTIYTIHITIIFTEQCPKYQNPLSVSGNKTTIKLRSRSWRQRHTHTHMYFILY